MNRWGWGATLVNLLVLARCAAAPVPTDGAPANDLRTYRGASDASAAEFLDATTVVVADDEDNVLRFYDAEAGGLPRYTLDLSSFLGLAPEDESDLEGAARTGDRIYWITSHGRNKKGKERRERGRLFATEITRSGDRVSLKPVGRPYGDLLPALLQALETYHLGLDEAAGIDSQGRTVPRDATLAPKAAGLNIEALAAAPDGKTLYLGFRNPRPEIRGSKHALVVPLLDPAATIDEGKALAFGEPLLWDLSGDGLRSMSWSEAHNEYFLIAGAPDDGRRLRVWRWNGERGSQPVAISSSAEMPPDLVPEALTSVPDFGAGPRRLLALADDGDRRIPVARAADCKPDGYRDDGTCRNKDLRDPGQKTFRGFELTP